jgi:hypothetical protein
VDIALAITESLKRHPAVRKVELTGSRRTGAAHRWSDWDFSVEIADFEIVSASLPGLIRNLEPISYLWDPLSDYWVFMMILKGLTKVDFIFSIPHKHEPPWAVNSETLMEINSHFWDWIFWIAGKQIRGLNEMVGEELKKMHSHLLAPLGVKETPASVGEAVKFYLSAFRNQKELYQKEVDPTLETEVLKGLREMGFKI